MKTTVFNEDLVGVHPRNDNTGKVDTGAVAFQGLGIGARTPRMGVKTDAEAGKEFRVGRVTR